MAAFLERPRQGPLMSGDAGTALLAVPYDVRVTELPDESGLPALHSATADLEAQTATRVAVGSEVPEALQEPDVRAELVGMSAAVAIARRGQWPGSTAPTRAPVTTGAVG